MHAQKRSDFEHVFVSDGQRQDAQRLKNEMSRVVSTLQGLYSEASRLYDSQPTEPDFPEAALLIEEAREILLRALQGHVKPVCDRWYDGFDKTPTVVTRRPCLLPVLEEVG